MDSAHIRNFSIIAHIDHGKTTLSDRLLHRTGTISDREMQEQLLDSMDLERERAIFPIINKIALPHANVAVARLQLEEILAIPADTAILASAKEGIGIDEILEAIVARIPAPRSTGEKSLQALSFDSYFDTYKGVVTHVRVFNGELKAGMLVKLLHSGKTFEVKEVGSFNPRPYVRERLATGETG